RGPPARRRAHGCGQGDPRPDAGLEHLGLLLGTPVRHARSTDVLVIVPVADAALARIAAGDPRVNVVDARGWFDDELRETWPPWTGQRYLGHRQAPPSSRPLRDELLAGAEVILGGFPFPLDLRARASGLRWFHQLPAGASNLTRG